MKVGRAVDSMSWGQSSQRDALGQVSEVVEQRNAGTIARHASAPNRAASKHDNESGGREGVHTSHDIQYDNSTGQGGRELARASTFAPLALREIGLIGDVGTSPREFREDRVASHSLCMGAAECINHEVTSL